MSNQFNQKHTNENLNFNLILGIGQEYSAILNLIEKYLSSTTSLYLSQATEFKSPPYFYLICN